MARVVAPAAKAATATIPIVFLTGDDPVANGLVASLNRPGGNITGVGITGPILLGKQLGVLHQFVSAGNSIVFLVNPANPNSKPSVKGAQEAARALGRKIRIVNASTEAEIDKAFAALSATKADGLIVAPDAFFIARRDQLVDLIPWDYSLTRIAGTLGITPDRGILRGGLDELEQGSLVVPPELEVDFLQRIVKDFRVRCHAD